jgi:hypothetical protein
MSNDIDLSFDLFSLSSEDLNKKILEATEYLSKLSDPSDIFNENNKAFETYIFIGKTIAYKNEDVDKTIFTRNNFPVFVGKILMYFYQINSELDFREDVDKMFYADQETDLNAKRIYIFCYSLYIMNINVMNTVKFSVDFASSVGLDAYFNFITDEEFVAKNLDKNMVMFEKSISVIEYLVMNISTLTKA